jgi:Secretion system C-terminal sorting domain
MKSILILLLSSFYLLNLQAQSEFTDNPELWGKGFYNPFYDGKLRNGLPLVSYRMETWDNKAWILKEEISTSYKNCNKPITALYRSFIGTNIYETLDSFTYSNGDLFEILNYYANTTYGKSFDSREKHFYSNGRLDSIISITNTVNRFNRLRYFTYDIPNGITTETVVLDSSKVKRTFLDRITSQLDTNGNLIRYKTEYFKNSKWNTGTEQLISWSSNKVLSIKLIIKPGLNYGSNFVLDTSRYRVVYYGSTNKIDSIFNDSHDSISNKWYRDRLYVNEKPNSKGFPTKITEYFTNNYFTPVEDYELGWDKSDDIQFLYYSGDTLVRQFIYPQNKRETFQYCGIPTLTATNELQTFDFKIYPNPTNQVLNIEIPQNTEGPSIEIFNAMGIMVSKTKQLNIDVSTLPIGIYFVQIKTKDRVGVKRFIVNRT